MAFPLTHHTMMSLQNEEPSPTPFSDWEDMSFDDVSLDYTNRLQIQGGESKNLSLFVVIPGIYGFTVSSFDVFTNQHNADSVYKTDECVATEFEYDFLGHDATVVPGPVVAKPPHYAVSWTTSLYASKPTGNIYRQHIVLDNPIVMRTGWQYGFIVTTRGNVDNTSCVCSSKVSGQNLMLSSTEWYSSGVNEITFSWWEAQKFCFNLGGNSPSIILYE